MCVPAPPSGLDGGGGRNRTGVHGFAGRCITTLPPRRNSSWHTQNRTGHGEPPRAGPVPRTEFGHGLQVRRTVTGIALSAETREPDHLLEAACCGLSRKPLNNLPHSRRFFRQLLELKRGKPVAFPGMWSGKRGSNSRPQPWQGCALPLSYSRLTRVTIVIILAPMSRLTALQCMRQSHSQVISH